MKGMQAVWGRKIGDLARSEFMRVLTYVASIKNKVVHLVDRFFPSSKTCFTCKNVYKELQLFGMISGLVRLAEPLTTETAMPRSNIHRRGIFS